MKVLAKTPGLYQVPKLRNATTATATTTTTTTTTCTNNNDDNNNKWYKQTPFSSIPKKG